MAACRWTTEIEAHFDGESQRPEEARAHLSACPDCARHWERLEGLRDGVAAALPEARIADTQFNAFMAGIREEMHAAPAAGRGLRAMWAYLSLAAAAVIVAFSAFYIVADRPEPIEASVVESATTELEGATIDFWHNDDDGVATIWINQDGSDLW